ncbi:MAG TPA: hypothetical protein VIZ43_14450 [Trebonia sp.]
MRERQKAQRGVVERVCLALGGSGVGSLGTLAVAHSSSASTVIAVAAAAAVASLGAALPGIIGALSAKRVARINAETESRVAVEGAQQRTTLVQAGLDGRLDAALSLLRLQPLDARVLADPLLSDETLRALLPGPRGPAETIVPTAIPPAGIPPTAVPPARPEPRPVTQERAPEHTRSRPIDTKRRRSRPSAGGTPWPAGPTA